MSYDILLTDNNRSRAYLQNFIRYGYIPNTAIVLGKEKQLPTSRKREPVFVQGIDVCFVQEESVLTTLQTYDIPFTCFSTVDTNDTSVIDAVARLKGDNIIYSGAGGIILQKEILSQGKRFFHSHPGIVPDYKGSTTFYYSMLLRRMIGCSIMVMSEDLDAGEVVFLKEYTVPQMPTDYDMAVDPLIRTQTFISLMQSVSGNLQNVKPRKQKGEGNMFYIIHPVLKHLAILKQDGKIKECER